MTQGSFDMLALNHLLFVLVRLIGLKLSTVCFIATSLGIITTVSRVLPCLVVLARQL